jgi:hypothetical protein
MLNVNPRTHISKYKGKVQYELYIPKKEVQKFTEIVKSYMIPPTILV